MAQFMDVHEGFQGASQADLIAAHEADLAIEAEEGVHFEHVWLDDETGRAFCLATGPSREAVMRVHERAGHPVTEVYEITAEA